MKPINYKFRWFEKEDRRKLLRASVSRDGKLRLGRTLRSKLPRFIQVGFDTAAMVLAIADGHGAGIDCPACGVLTAQALSEQITAAGLHLPVAFALERDRERVVIIPGDRDIEAVAGDIWEAVSTLLPSGA